jgi:4-alpha-glucanotransferase
MRWSDLVDRLAALAGVEFFYFDVGGKRHETALETKVLVLSALGFDIGSIGAAAASLAAMEERTWRESLAPTLVRPAGDQGIVLDFHCPAETASQNRTWEILFENGESVRRDFRAADLPLRGVRDIDGRRIEQRTLHLGAPDIQAAPPGYHRLVIAGDMPVQAVLVLTPEHCFLPEAFAGGTRRLWGLSTHIYTLRSARNGGIGDFGDLRDLATLAGEAGASTIATNPFHTLFPNHPGAASPYSPSSRLFLNPIYIAVDAAPGADAANLSASEIAAVRADPLVDYAAVWAAKGAGFEALYTAFQNAIAASSMNGGVEEFRRFVAEGGQALNRFAAFSAFEEQYPGKPWPQWPETIRTPENASVQAAISGRADRVGFHLYLQYLADRQLRAAAEAARHAGMGIGILRDLALGANPDGADNWARREIFVQGLRCGAPPDEFNPHGQEWGVLPLDPLRLRRDYEPFAAILRANMRHAGGLRIDHIIGMQHQFLVPLGGHPAQGCYLRFPLDDVFAILALESHRNACMVIGEDLGTVPPGLRDRMADVGVLGSSILYFEKTQSGFRAPSDYRVKTAACAATHDLPTLAGYWEGRDVALRLELGIATETEAENGRREREEERRLLFQALKDKGLVDHGEALPVTMTQSLLNAIHAYIASSAAALFLAQLDDLSGEKDPINVPGTVDLYPNWRRKLHHALDDPALKAQIDMLESLCRMQARGRS